MVSDVGQVLRNTNGIRPFPWLAWLYGLAIVGQGQGIARPMKRGFLWVIADRIVSDIGTVAHATQIRDRREFIGCIEISCDPILVCRVWRLWRLARAIYQWLNSQSIDNAQLIAAFKFSAILIATMLRRGHCDLGCIVMARTTIIAPGHAILASTIRRLFECLKDFTPVLDVLR